MISAKTQVLALFGDPVGHSLSPIMHNGWIEDHGLDAVYVALRLTGEDPASAFRALKNIRLKGANVTVPHKEAAASAADRSEARVANVLRWEGDGSLSAFNTDGVGFVGALDEAACDWRARTKSILILGAGGGAEGVAMTLAGVGNIVIANRTRGRADELAGRIAHARTADWDQLPELFAEADLIVQATTLGMSAGASPDWPLHACRPSAIAVDIVYRPLETPFLMAARRRGLVAVDGLGMLIHQGAAAFEIWFGVKPSTMKARARLMAALGENP